MILLVATTNAGKLREIRALLAGLPFDVRLLDPSTDIAPPEETGETFAENARLKARYYAQATGLLTVAEDSGLEIDALDGRPGVLSARYPGTTYAERFRNLYAELAARDVAIASADLSAAAASQEAFVTPRAATPAASPVRATTSSAAEEPRLVDTRPEPASAAAAPANADVASPGSPAWTARFACAVALARGDEIVFEALGTVEGFIAAAPRGTHGFGYDPIFFYPPDGCTFGEVTDENKSRVSARGAAFRALREFLSQPPPP